MSLTPRQQSELVDQVMHLQRTLQATVAALVDIRDTRVELGVEVSTFLEPYFTVAQWQSAHTTLTTMATGLAARIKAAQGDGLDKLRPEPTTITGKFTDAGF